ncbi:MAG: hypothetical protein R3A10_17405 [Caldilineaceae bacterium]
MLDTESGPAFIDGAIYRFTRTDNLRFYRAAPPPSRASTSSTPSRWAAASPTRVRRGGVTSSSI